MYCAVVRHGIQMLPKHVSAKRRHFELLFIIIAGHTSTIAIRIDIKNEIEQNQQYYSAGATVEALSPQHGPFLGGLLMAFVTTEMKSSPGPTD
ncbi:hypothetical protein EVAR_86831_1 [Eumeta japonica]|uniref:Uncharacterized protein n=1 Tax=Eumeta variegata TaxID=151549 RepID=A0A4C1VT37_EUMVA|nr:hypothetical protein EVAR_86831_1 [Eumeta japonica]